MCTESGHVLNKCYRLCEALTPDGDSRTPGGDSRTPGGGSQTRGGDSRTPGGYSLTPLQRSLGNQQRLAQVSISIPRHALPLASQSFNYRVQSKDGTPKTKPVIISSVLSQNYS